MKRFIRAAAPNFGYGLTVLATLFLGNIGLILATLAHPEQAAGGHFGPLLAFSIIGSLAAIFTGLNINQRHPLADRSAALWIWLLGLPVSRRLAEMSLSVKWDENMTIEAALLGAAVIVVLMSAGRLAPEKAP
ncbi:MAG TPA: hypothetical protein VHS81_10840 [Caulobacteraceae bacterium]|jgi:hypothetical protein|nr:hypothetical protein [Caulobacteraceae bacterium]